MRGPVDDSIPETATENASVDRRGGARATGARGRMPGGKALLRLLDLLDQRGLEQTAEAVVERAVSPEDRPALQAIVEERGLTLPAAMAGAPPGARVRRRRRGGVRTAGAAGDSDAPPETQEYAVASAAAAHAAPTAVTRAGIGEVSPLHPTGPPTGTTGPFWRSIGPVTIPNGQTYGSSRVNVSGRVSCIAIHPTNPARILCGAANGGVWESFDRGNTWAPRTDYAPTTAVGALTYDRSNPAVVYCGTGEGNWWSFLGAGILRSANGGTTWVQHCTDPFVGLGFYSLIVNPANSNHLLAGTTGGLYVSTNGGTVWTRRRTGATWSVVMAPAGRAAAEILASTNTGIVRSVDGGVNWAAVALPGAPPTFDRLAVDVCRSSPTVAYAWGARGATAYLWRRAGGTWTAITVPPGARTNQAWYDWFVAAAPDRDSQVYCGDIEVHRGDLSGTTWTWRNITNKGTSGQSIHPDQHAIAFEPGTNTIYVGNDGGLYRSPDRGITFQHCNNGLVISEFEYLAHHPGSARWLIGGTQDNGTARWTGAPAWDHIADGDGGDCGVNRGNPTTVFHTYYGMSPERSTSSGNFGSWSDIRPPVPADEGSLFYPPFEASATAGDTIAIGGGALYISRNNGTNWTRSAFPGNGTATALFIPNADTVFVGLQDGRVFRTRWNGSSWTALTALTTPRANAVVSDLFVDPANQARIWATHSTRNGGRIFRSDNGGASWADRSAGLPELPANAVAVDDGNANRLWVALDKGVYQSINGGTSWTDFANGLPNAFIGDLLFHSQARVLRAATRNRGVWEIPVDGWMTAAGCGVQFTGNLAANQTQRWFTHSWPATWHVIWTVMPTNPVPGAPQVTWRVQVERASPEFLTYWITVQNLTAGPVAFEGRYCILSRY
jgi:hypothetical protein